MIGVGFLAEIPTGALADSLGKKTCLKASFFLNTLGFAGLALSPNFAVFCVSLVVITLGMALCSGTFEALIFDVLVDENQPDRYRTVIANANGFRLLFLAVTCGVGGFLYAWDPRLPYTATSLGYALGFGFVFLLAEPQSRKRHFTLSRWWRSSRAGLDRVWRALRERSTLSFLWICGSLLVFADEILNDVLAVAFGFNERQLGLFSALAFCGAALASKLSGSLAARFSSRSLYLSCFSVVTLSLLISPLLSLWIGGLTVLVRYMSHAAFHNWESAELLKMTSPDHRATTLSAFTMIKNLPYLLLAVAIGAAIDQWGAKPIAFWLGILLLLALGLTGKWLRRTGGKKA